MKVLRITIAMAALLLAPALFAQQIQCLPQGQDLPMVPEIQRDPAKNLLKGTIVVSAAQERMTFRTPATAPTPASGTQCYPQWVRVFRGLNTTPPMPPISGPYGDPMPGPTLRARVGDLINLTLLNQIDPGKFPYSIDRGDTNSGCDQSSTYPGNPPLDTYPDCFHGSSTANIHFHGTHTNPNSTGDNVFIEIRPSPRTKDAANAPLVTADTVKAPFDQFFADCATHLTPANPLSLWPYTWSDLPKSWTDTQEALLKQYDSNPNLSPTKRLWPVDAAQIAQGAWPQYYIGAYPYCFQIPQYTQTSWPPVAPKTNPTAAATAAPAPAPAPATAHATHQPEAGTGGAGTAEIPGEEPLRPLVMGQSPGTHWYHAHKHGSTAINVANGMTGAFILEGQYDDDLNKFYGPNWTAGAKVMVINQLGVTPNLVRGGGGAGQGPDKGPDFSVNGRLKPTIQMKPGEVQMWRIVNTTGRAGTQFAAPSNGVQWKQLAQDGVQFKDANYQQALNQSFLLMSGNRADLLVKAPTKAGVYPIMVQNMVDPRDLPQAAPLTLLTITVADKAKPATGNAAQFIPTAPSFPPFLADITDQEISGTKRIVFASTNPPAQHTIDGKKFDGEVGEVVLLNTVEEWKVSNETTNAISHPFHIHINPFQVTEVFDPNALLTDANGKPVIDPTTKKQANQYVFVAPTTTTPLLAGQCYIDPNANPDSWKPCGPKPAGSPIWWDVFPIPSAATANNSAGTSVVIPGYFKMRSRFVDYSGYYVIHCHILAHEDRGMMTIVQVAPYRSPYSHH